MILLFPKNYNNNFLQILNDYKSMVNLPYLECPNCNSSNLIRWGYYNRIINFINSNALVYDSIKIIRVRCNDCNHTHALLPSCIVPYKTSLLDVILNGILDSQNPISINYSIDNIIKWKKEFNIFLPYLKTYFNHSSNIDIISNFLNNIHYHYYLFYKYHNLIFMLMRSCLFNMFPF